MVLIAILLFIYFSIIVYDKFHKENKIEFPNGSTILFEELNKKEEIKSLDAPKQVKKKIKLQKGDRFISTIDVLVVDTFFSKDIKFGVVCPVINNVLIQIPAMIQIGDSSEIIWDTELVDEEVRAIGMEKYKQYKKKNQDKFLN